jgi:hypothetical protein
VYDLVLQLYANVGIELEQRENILYKKGTDIEVVKMENKYLGLDALPTNIQGYPKKLMELGWYPEKSIATILLGIATS